ncbi:Helix-turn-helix domain protein [Thalassovita gelatinovora]|uniref:Helix-turn-helix domain protein n=1 Tax=Thalassovita gelatinovora TaxID=53501 RepID=A0A0P1F9T1_THAGE|nr:helix-turn-helix transcriptional regulator [Thalassovita gelatinovora]QIZ81300.1 helix-turn-helix transcriptional regulator [Thalassovita gelatinovora]CUH64543.1 Helix-turn-helix domain protein [Thalassovita gelatinovora]SEP96493.1 Helix-turn-helix domain-containing protein [Thalassovita gelatinovora]
MKRTDLSANLRLLAGYGKSISAICKAAKINRTQFHRYLNGDAEPTLNTLRRICDYFGVEEYEIMMSHTSFRELVRLRPPQLHETVDPFREIQNRIYAGEGPVNISMGYYHMLFRPDPETGIYYRALVRMQQATGGIIFKMVERFPRPALSLPSRLVSEGTGFVHMGKLYCLMQEVKFRRSTWFNVLNVGDSSNAPMLNGVATGSEPEGTSGIKSFPIVWLFLGERPDLRQALSACGYYRADEITLPPEADYVLSADL